MKYWAYLVAKLVVAAGLVFGLGYLINHFFPPPRPFSRGGPL